MGWKPNIKNLSIFFPSFLAIENFQNHIEFFWVLSFAIWRNFAIKKRLDSRRFLQYTRSHPPPPKKKPPPKTGRERGEKGTKEPVRLRSRVRTPVRAIKKSSCASCGACSEASALQRRHNAHSARCLPFALPSLLRPSQFSAHATGSLDGLIIVTSILLFTHCGFWK